MLRKFAAKALGEALVLTARFITAVRGIWAGIEPDATQRVYFANHTSNGDFMLIWTVLPPRIRKLTRPVAAADYWLKNPLRAFVGKDVLDAVLIERRPDKRDEDEDPVGQIIEAIDGGASLIIFPEGRRNEGEDLLLPFKTGIWHIAKARPKVDLVPVWIENMNQVMPRGEILPIPLICTVTFGAPIRIKSRESKDKFLGRASEALSALAEAERQRA